MRPHLGLIALVGAACGAGIAAGATAITREQRHRAARDRQADRVEAGTRTRLDWLERQVLRLAGTELAPGPSRSTAESVTALRRQINALATLIREPCPARPGFGALECSGAR